MKDHVEIGHLTKYDAFRVNRDQAMNLEVIIVSHTRDSVSSGYPSKHREESWKCDTKLEVFVNQFCS